MKREGIAPIVLRFARTILLADLVLAVLVALACYVLDLRTSGAYGTILIWVGTALVILACIIGIGGFASRGEDAIAFCRSGAGNMIENLQRISDARSSNLGCFVHLVFAALMLIGTGYLVQIISYLF